jgi:hypothetical protein
VEIIPPEDFQFEFGTGFVHTTEEWMARVEAGEAPRNLIQLRELGRLTIVAEFNRASIDDGSVVRLSDALRSHDHDRLKELGIEPLHTRDWSPNDCEHYGQWLHCIVTPSNNVPSRVSKGVLMNGYLLGAGISDTTLRRNRYTSLSEFYVASGFVTLRTLKHGPNALLNDQQLADHAEKVFLAWKEENPAKSGNEINLADEIDKWAKLNGGPDIQYFRRNGKSLKKLMALNGYVDSRAMSREETISLGANIREANNGQQVTKAAINFLSTWRRAPSAQFIDRTIGWDNFLEGVKVAVPRQRTEELHTIQQKAAAIRQEAADNLLPVFVVDSESDEEIIRRKARWQLINHLSPKLNFLVKRIIVQYVSADDFEKAVCDVGVANWQDIYVAAHELELADEIWQVRKEPFMEYLKVPEELLRRK